MLKAIIFIGFLILSLSASSQEKCSKAEQIERIKSQKVAFITEKIGLNPATAQNFWPVYNEFSSKKDSLITTRSMARRKLENNQDNMTNAQKEASLDLQISIRWQEAELDRHYHDKFKKVLTIDQLIKLYQAEHEFRLRLIRQIRKIKAESNSLGDSDFDLSLTSMKF